MSLETTEKAFTDATDPAGSKLHAAILGGVDKNGIFCFQSEHSQSANNV